MTETSASSPLDDSSASPVLVGPTVSTQWLADHLGNPRIVVLDASVLFVPSFDGRSTYLSGEDQYLVDGHLPDAIFGDVIEDFSDPDGPYGFTRPDADRFARTASTLGIDADTTVIVYDSSFGQWAARVWWLFRSFGHDAVAVLDGGLTAWRAEGRPLDTGHIEPREGRTFVARERDGFWVGTREVAAIVDGSAPGSLVCALPPKEFAGVAGQRPRLGHIPGSTSVPASRLVDRETNKLLPSGSLKTLFGDALDASPVVLYCGGGIAAAGDALALTVLGRDDVVVYDGSLNEWVADPDAPLAVVAA